MAAEYYGTPALRKDKKITQKQRKKGKKIRKEMEVRIMGETGKKGGNREKQRGRTGENGKQPTFGDNDVISSFLFHFLILIHLVQ